MSRFFYAATAALAAAFAGSVIAYHLDPAGWLLSLAISLGTTLYHFVYRLAVGYGLLTVFRNRMDYRRKWFREKPFEKPLYRALQVRCWKNRMPTFRPEWFDMRVHTPEEIVMAGCEAEIGHEINMGLSFLPVAFIPWLGAPAVFIVTSALGAALDLSFVMMQRYNRPRLLRLMARKA